MNYADPIVIEKFKSLPQKLKDVLFSEDTTDTIFAIGKENGLTVFQMEELADETGLVILGITAPDNFAKNVEKRLTTNTEKATPIARAINEKIFNPILGDLVALIRPSVSLEIPSTKNEDSKKTTTIVQPLEVKTIITPKSVEQIVVPIPKPLTEPQVFAKPIPDPYREPLSNTSAASFPKPRIVSWEDVLKNKSKEPEAPPDAKIALEKAMSDAVAPPPVVEKIVELPQQNTIVPPKYEGKKDPYREPLD
ncbi:MAG: hypothetical protein AAB795_03770 [Patescibacteria group bacterium]